MVVLAAVLGMGATLFQALQAIDSGGRLDHRRADPGLHPPGTVMDRATTGLRWSAAEEEENDARADDRSVAAGPVGAGTAAGTAGLSVDLLSYSVLKGLYGGFSVDGSGAGVRTALNHAYYGKPVSPADILVKGAVKNPHAPPLIEAVAKLTGH